MVKNTAETTYDELKQQILSGILRPAEHLVESTLAESLNTSRHNVRNALDHLKNDGLVEIEPNKGARVTSLTLEEVVDMYIAREGLEAEIIRLAVEKITGDQIDEMQALLDSMKEAFAEKKFGRYSELNKEFHQIIYIASGNFTLPDLISQIRLRLARLNIRVIMLPGRGDSSLTEHIAIYEAIAQRDKGLAVLAVRQHISAVRRDIGNGWDIVRI